MVESSQVIPPWEFRKLSVNEQLDYITPKMIAYFKDFSQESNVVDSHAHKLVSFALL
jgi:hypothetical protein